MGAFRRISTAAYRAQKALDWELWKEHPEYFSAPRCGAFHLEEGRRSDPRRSGGRDGYARRVRSVQRRALRR